MASVTRNGRRVKALPQRRIRWLARPEDGAAHGILRITMDGAATDYIVRELQCDWGRGWELMKLVPGQGGTEVYHVHLNRGDGQEGDSCDCRGFLRWNHCKHRDGLKVLTSN
jgi:hypothetical protein